MDLKVMEFSLLMSCLGGGGYYHYIKRRIVTYRKQTYLYILNRYIIIEQIINDQTLIHSIKQR